MTLTARPRLLIRFAVLAALALCGIVLALSSTGTPPVGAQDGSVPAKPTGVVTTATHDSVALALGRSRRHQHLPLPDIPAGPRRPRRRRVRHHQGRHRLGGDELHGRHRGARDALCVPGEGGQPARGQHGVQFRPGPIPRRLQTPQTWPPAAWRSAWWRTRSP